MVALIKYGKYNVIAESLETNFILNNNVTDIIYTVQYECRLHYEHDLFP